MSGTSGRRYTVTFGDTTYVISLAVGADGALSATIDGVPVPLDVLALGPDAYSLLIGDESVEAGVAATDGGWIATLGGLAHEMEVADEALARFRPAAASKAGSGKDVVRAPMPGLVVGVHAAPGDIVPAGVPLIVLEAMKMQNELSSKHGGTVQSITVQVGDKVDKGQVLATLERRDG